MTVLPVSEARKSLPAVIESARSHAVVLQRHGEPVAVVMSPERYEQLLAMEEELADVDAFDDAMAETGSNIPWETVKADLGWL